VQIIHTEIGGQGIFHPRQISTRIVTSCFLNFFASVADSRESRTILIFAGYLGQNRNDARKKIPVGVGDTFQPLPQIKLILTLFVVAAVVLMSRNFQNNVVSRFARFV
jgi:hypothetical protein